jgi:ABC-type amino acid transport substrate-binding protein
MIKILSRLILVSLLFSSNLIMAKQEIKIGVGNQEIKIGVGNFPPFFVEEEQQGLFMEITKEIFKQLPDYSVKFIYMSNYRLLHEINSGKRIDVACNIFSDSKVDAFLSSPVFRFTDVAVSKNSAKIELNKVEDLKGVSIAAYQGAKELLGADFKKMAMANPQYSEHSQPKDTTYMMVSGQKDVRVGDINIFLHDLTSKRYKNEAQIDVKNFTIHRLWPDVYSHMAFKDETLRDSVDEIIKELTINGKIEAIYLKYQYQYQYQ